MSWRRHYPIFFGSGAQPCPSSKEYVTVSQDRIHLEVFRRQRAGRGQWEVLTK